ncbi:MAG: hydroxymethylbilane synthase [Acidimicrobiales bacterium]
MRLRIATRGSELALWQARYVASLIDDRADVEILVVSTEGDRVHDRAISEIGGRGVFVKEVQAAVMAGRADIAVHSAKDLPASESPPGLIICCVPERGDPRDALVGATLSQLRPGAVVATGSVRRQAQLAHLRPDLQFVSLRGNIATRLARSSEVDAVAMASVALHRLGLQDHIAETLDTSVMLPQVGQAALAVECREDDAQTAELLLTAQHLPSRICVDTERSFLAEMGGGCEVPVGAYATLADDTINVEGLVAGFDGRVLLRSSLSGSGCSIGAELANQLLNDGGAALLGQESKDGELP